MVFDLTDILPALPEMLLATLALVLVLVAAYGGEGASNARRVTRIALGGIVLALALIWSGTSGDETAFGGMFRADSFADYMKILVLLGTFSALYMSITPLAKDDINKPEFALLVMLALVGMMLMISANDLMSLYMAVELQSLPLYVVAAMRTNSLRSSEAGLKYFLLGALSSGMLLYGASLVYGFAGTTSFSSIAAAVSADQLPAVFIVGMVFMVSGIAFKISAAPFHMWTPDVYQGSPSPVTALFAIAPKVAAMALMMRLTYGAFGSIEAEWSQVLVALSIASMVVGALGAIMQTDIKRMMAYSSIAHMGYALAGLAAGTQQGALGVMIYMTGYIFMGAGAFAIILLMRRDGQSATRIADLQGLSRTHPMLALGLMVMMFSMAGIPPLAGFFGKWYVFLAAVNAGLIPLAVIGVVMSVVGAFYYLRIIKIMYFEDTDEPLDTEIPVANKIVLGVSIVVILLFFVGLSPLLETAGVAADSLMAQL
ncbi:MAG: NADH-quinone oxidoreductase subunit NuoN [Proteobacteria bacterium]|nr:NADH-quinone oxidoreductase subunit NuoN [Pseudomonadota bacterium]MDA0960267.1 NADH-quinone oxidoreductase subunit NuoN [Pseudomonadota bacterium]MDA1152054.1 NADH-quinone oxidoreductase subunit NuoN [Pseudomonadota bacterium]